MATEDLNKPGIPDTRDTIKKVLQHKTTRRGFLVGLAAAGAGAIGLDINNQLNNGSNDDRRDVSGVVENPVASPTEAETPEAIVNASPTTAINTATSDLTEISTSQSTPAAEGTPTPTEAPTQTPEPTATPVLTPEQKIEENTPYSFHNVETFTQANKQLDYFTSLSVGTDNKLYEDTQQQISKVFVNEKVPNGEKKLESAVVYGCYNALKSQNPTQYGELTLDQFKTMLKEKNAPKLILPNALKDKELKLFQNVEVDLSKPIFINFIGGIYGDNLGLSIEGTGYNGFRVVDGGLVIECFRQDLFQGDGSPNIREFNAYNQLWTALIMLGYYDFQKNFANEEYKRQDKFSEKSQQLNGKDIQQLLVPNIVPHDIPDSTFLLSVS